MILLAVSSYERCNHVNQIHHITSAPNPCCLQSVFESNHSPQNSIQTHEALMMADKKFCQNESGVKPDYIAANVIKIRNSAFRALSPF